MFRQNLLKPVHLPWSFCSIMLSCQLIVLSNQLTSTIWYKIIYTVLLYRPCTMYVYTLIYLFLYAFCKYMYIYISSTANMIVPSKEYFACNIPGEPSVLLIDSIDKPVAGVCHHKSDQLGAWHIEVMYVLEANIIKTLKTVSQPQHRIFRWECALCKHSMQHICVTSVLEMQDQSSTKTRPPSVRIFKRCTL